MKRKTGFALVLSTFALVSLCASYTLAATVPQLMNYQGRLNDNLGSAVTGTKSIAFSLYSSATTTTPLWTETQNVTVNSGAFNAILGSGALPLPLAVFDNPAVWLGIKVDTDSEMTPRQRITSAGYAIKAAVADNARSVDEGAIGAAQLAGGSVGSAQLAAGSITNTAVAANAAIAYSKLNHSDADHGAAYYSKAQVDAIVSAATGSLAARLSSLESVRAGFTWSTLTGNVQAAANTGYLANSPGTGYINITLPSAPAVGDAIRVTGIGTGKWKILQNAGQTIAVDGVWAPVTVENVSVVALATSRDGSRIAAAAGRMIYTSTDAGANWTASDIRQVDPNFTTTTVTMSSNGAIIYSVTSVGDTIVRSSDSGATWEARGTGIQLEQPIRSLAASDDGTHLVAASGVGWGEYIPGLIIQPVLGGTLYQSINSGAEWSLIGAQHNWSQVASSADGNYLLASVAYFDDVAGSLYWSANLGATWQQVGASGNWSAVAMTPTASVLGAAVKGGSIYLGSDPANMKIGGPIGNWTSLAMSSDGKKMAAVDENGQIQITTNGKAWNPESPAGPWSAIAMSADGSTLYAAQTGGRIYKWMPNTTAGTTGYIGGGANDSVELRYVGNNTFVIVNHEGSLTVK